MDENKLRQMLLEDIGDDDFLPLVRQINALPHPVALTSAEALADAILPRPHWWEWYPLLILRSQLRVVAAGIFLASALVLLLGAVVTLGVQDADHGQLPLVILAPIVAALGIGLLYDGEQSYELEDAAPVGLPMLLLARMTLVFMFDLVVALVCSVVISVLSTQLTLFDLVEAWLFPMTFISALAFFVAALSGNPVFALVISIGAWVSHVLWLFDGERLWLRDWFAFDGLAANNLQLMIVSGVMIGGGLWFLANSDYRIKES